MDSTTALKQMWKHADKPERMRLFHRIVFELGVTDAEEFWSNFWSIWESSENLHEDRAYIEKLLAHGLTLGDSKLVMEDEERAMLEDLPEPIQIYRGCIKGNETGWSWTVNRAKAELFAKRAVGGTVRQIITGKVNKENVLAVLTGRNESEIVVLPEHVFDQQVDESYELPPQYKDQLMYNIHSGRMPLGDDELRAEMIVNTVKDADVTRLLESLESDMTFCKWAKTSNVAYLESLMEKLKQKVPNGTVVVTETLESPQ